MQWMGIALGVGLVALSAGPAFAGDVSVKVRPNVVRDFATIPSGARFPEGIAGDPATGDIFVGTFDAAGTNDNKLFRYRRNGSLEAQKNFHATPLLGLAFNSRDRKVYIANFGASQIQRIPANFGPSTPVEVVAALPAIGAPGDRIVVNPDMSEDVIEFGSNSFPGPNALTFARNGTLYISDSFQGAIFSIANADTCNLPCPVTTVVQHPLLATAGFPPFGANGLALNATETELFVANTGDDRILKVTLATGAVTSFAESINGADGLAFDDQGTLWVAANQSDQVLGLDDQGRVRAVLGANFGVRRGRAKGLLFPASLVIVGRNLYVTNLALGLTGGAVGEIEEAVTTYSVSRIRLGRFTQPDLD